MSNTNYIQETEIIQSFSQTFKITKQQFEENKFLNDAIKNPRYVIAFLYLITHKETGYIYSGSHLAYSLKDANTYYGSSKGKTISDICTKDKILQNGVDQYEFKLIMFCKSTEQMRKREYELNHFNIYFNGLKCLNGNGRGSSFRSRAGISHTNETKQKISKSTSGEKNGNFGNKHSEETKQYLSEYSKTLWNNMSEETKMQKEIDRLNTLNNRTEEEKNKTKQKRSNSLKGKTKNKNYYCPYDILKKGIPWAISCWIKRYYPNEKQWPDFTKEEKESYLVISHNCDVD